MGELSAGLREPATGPSRRNFVYRVLRHEVCRQAFSEIYTLSHHSLQSLQEFVEAGRIAPPPHKLSGRPASHAISAGFKADIITFIRLLWSKFWYATACCTTWCPPYTTYIFASILDHFAVISNFPDGQTRC